MSNSEIAKKIADSIKLNKCTQKNCLSNQKDPLELAWFGHQYDDHKQITCTSCFICNNEAVKNSLPTNFNILPLSSFTDKFVEEMKLYEGKKNSKEFAPKVVKERSKEILADLEKSEAEINDTLASLHSALIAFCKKVEKVNGQIFKNQIFDELIVANDLDKFDILLDKILQLISLLNCDDQSAAYRFDDVEKRNKKIVKLNEKIKGISKNTIDTLAELLKDLRERNQNVKKM